MFDSKTFLYSSLHIDHRTLEKYLKNGNRYLFRFIFSLSPLVNFSVDGLVTLSELKLIFTEVRKDIHNGDFQQQKSKHILAENLLNSELTNNYPSINSCAKSLKGDRFTIRKYLEGKSSKPYYRNQ